MRLDLFLKASRLVLRRSIAKKLCETGKIFVNGIEAKASKEVSVGDEILLERGHRRTTVRVQNLPLHKQVSQAQASLFFEVLSDEFDADHEDY